MITISYRFDYNFGKLLFGEQSAFYALHSTLSAEGYSGMRQQHRFRFFAFSPVSTQRYLDRYGQFHELPKTAKVKTRVGIFGITISPHMRLLVTSPAHALDVFGLPGGGREKFETHHQTLQREYAEEIGPHFIIKKKIWLVYQQRILSYASDVNEYWRYDQYFYVCPVHHPKMPTLQWVTPEGGRANWIPIQEYCRITAAHRPAIVQYLRNQYR